VNDWRRAVSGPLAVSVAAIVVGAGVVFANAPRVMGSLFKAAASDPNKSSVDDELIAKHNEVVAITRSRVEGRYPFFTPPAWPQEPRKIEPIVRKDPEPEREPEPVEPKIPEKYSGPKLLALLGNMVHFEGTPTDGDLIVPLGEEVKGVKVLEIHAPWKARVAHAGGEYDVGLLDDEPLAGFTKDPFKGQALAALNAAKPGVAMPPPPPTPKVDRDADRNGAERNGKDRGRAARPARPPARDDAEKSKEEDGKPAEAGSEEPTIPEPRSADQIESMSKQEALEALQEVSKARKAADLDDATKDRLKEEYELLMKKVRSSS
jgi:hypothetical protein